MNKINIVTGHYGSGKTNFSANLAIKLSKNSKVTVVDLDIVNPYFRTADFAELFGGHNIELIKSMYANTNLDIPAISFDLERICTEDGYVIIDVGGDEDGAVALGRYAEAFKKFEGNIEFYFVVNKYRYISPNASEVVKMLREIENASQMKVTKIINNSNLGSETTASHILSAINFGKEVSQLSLLPLECTTAPISVKSPSLDGKVDYIDIYVKPIWDI